jgi:hypothetical protein
MVGDDVKTNPVDIWIVTKFRPFALKWLEFIRNLLVVSAFLYLSRKSQSPAIGLLGLITTVTFGVYCLSFLLLSLPISSKAKYPPDRVIMNIIITLVTCYLIYRWSFQLADIIENLATLQLSK